MTKLVLKPKKRKAGTRAGMNRAKIANAARKLWLSSDPGKFSLRAVAKALKVVPATIRAHYKGGMNDLLDEMAGSALAELAPPYKPQQDPKDYLRMVFRAALAAFRQDPQLGRLVVLHLSDDSLLNPVLAERICATLAAIDPNADLGWALRRFLERFTGLVAVETSRWAVGDPEKVEAGILKRIHALPSAEFPTLKSAAEGLFKGYKTDSSSGGLEKTADAAASGLIAEILGSGS